MKNVRIYRLARLEIAEATGRYDEVSPVLGDALVDELHPGLQQLAEFPLSTPLIRGEIHKRPLFRFPYSIFYREKGEAWAWLLAAEAPGIELAKARPSRIRTP